MNVMLISQCSKNALTETRRILDQFAERRGDRTWQTAITRQGLDTLHRLLRKTARKNTAVTCHWLRGKDHSELLWIVGDARQFNAHGATPTNTTGRDVLRSHHENDWHAATDIALLARIAALFHDFGKANDAFQKKLVSAQAIADAFRHEWVSLRLFEAFVGPDCAHDRDWLARLAQVGDAEAGACLHALIRDRDGAPPQPGPFKRLPPLAQAIGWLIVTHHRMPTTPGQALTAEQLKSLPGGIAHDWCGSRSDEKSAAACWSFKGGLPFDSRHWRSHVAKVVGEILQRPSLTGEHAAQAVLDSPYMLHLSRLALMLADHYYSGEPSRARYGDKPCGKGRVLYANTERDASGKPAPKQRLDEHLIGVEVNAGRIVRALPRLDRVLPRIARHRGFRERSKGAFRWQNTAFDLAVALHARSAQHGFFGVNLASTGSGKTLANGRILYGLANPQLGARFTIALGLRTLTLQTGDAYRERLGLGTEDMAVLVGGGATRALHGYQHEKQDAQTDNGSESAADLLPEHNHVRYEGSLEDGPLKRWLYPQENGRRRQRGHDAASLLDAPVLVCTIDHLMPATEATRGGHQILPMLRLMSSDLVLDEPDDFGIEDLPAVTRLVHWAGLLGSRVLLSSATLPPALVQGLFLAYCAGRREFRKHRGRPGESPAVCCAWFDEFASRTSDHNEGDEGQAFLAAHREFVDQRLGQLTRHVEPRRRAAIQPLPLGTAAPAAPDLPPREKRARLCEELAQPLRDHALALHAHHHAIDPTTGHRVSFGLIRMANIDPLFDVARQLFALGAGEGCRIHLCVYHSRHPMLVRAAIERELDAALKRHHADAVFVHRGVRQLLDAHPESDHLFIVLATAVAEVGRDHDYDWAIVEPSSMRSIIQLAGRVKRHRSGECPPDRPNIYLLNTNIAHLVRGDGRPAFVRPGFEADGQFLLASHQLSGLLDDEQYRTIDARARIKARHPLDPTHNLVDLEHARLADLMLGALPGNGQAKQPVHRWWHTRAHLSGELQYRNPFRRDPQGRLTYALLPDEDGVVATFHQIPDGDAPVAAGHLFKPLTAEAFPIGERIAPWGVPDYLTELQEIAEAMQMEPHSCALRFGTFDLPGRKAEQVWRYHPALGFSRR